jgi:multiple sugar transport system permease protein
VSVAPPPRTPSQSQLPIDSDAPVGTGTPRRRWREFSVRARENRDGLLLVAPTVLVVGGVVLYPFIRSILFSFQSIRLIDLRHLGLLGQSMSLDNFRQVLDDPTIWRAFRTTVIYSVASTVGSIGAGLAVALALRKPFRLRFLVRAMLLIPYVLPVVAAATTWRALLSPQYGPINAFGMRYLGWDQPINFLTTESTHVLGVPVPLALTTVIAFEIWRTFGLAYLFLTARLQAIPAELEEAALLDGATPVQTFRYLIWPQLSGVIALLAVLRLIWSFHNFTDIFLLTEGAGGTDVLAVRVYNEFALRSDIGAASALGVLFTLVLSGVLAVYVWLSRKETLA